jgi:hypothetical protein
LLGEGIEERQIRAGAAEENKCRESGKAGRIQ